MLTLAICLAILLALPATVLGLECVLALLPLRRHALPDASGDEIQLVVLIPAHNEEGIIADAILAVRQQLGSGHRIVVVADNCNDATADRARAVGAEVLERHDLTRRGKAFAVNFAVSKLRESPPEIVVIVDADCRPAPRCIETITRLAHERRQPVQSSYIMYAPQNADCVNDISAFAVYVKNVVRPRGLQRLGLPCLVNGAGVAYPWNAISNVTYPEDYLAEDYRFTIKLADAGFLVEPCMEAEVRSLLPSARTGFVSQRTRWEQGHILLSLTEPPRLILAALKRLSLRYLALALEMLVPPLSLQVALSVVFLLPVGLASWACRSWAPLLCYCGLTAFAAMSLFTIWLVEGRRQLSARSALRIPMYMALKAPFYMRFITNRQTTWERTERDASHNFRDL